MRFKCIVNGELLESSSGRFLEVRNPANVDEVVGEVPAMTAEEAERAVESSFLAFKSWSVLSPVKRAEIIKKGVKIAEEKSEEISRLLTLENGKTIKESREEVKSSLESIRYFAEGVLNILGESYPVDKSDRLSITIRQPVGVVSAIVPWNYPLLLLSWKIGPALATGCTVIAKPSHCTPLSTIKLAECFLEAGLPKGVLNVLTGKTSEIGRVLTEHPLVSKIAFTGSTSAGKNIMTSAADTVKRLTLELGGNCPFIAFEDADLNAAVKGAVRRAFRNCGQVCNAINRIYVHKSIFRDFVDLFVQETKKIKIGNGLREDVEMGPLTTKDGLETVKKYVEEAVGMGAKVLYGGRKPSGIEFEKGYFYEPTVLVDVDHSMKVVKNEVFGPTAPIMSFETFEEAIQKANDTEYGLVSYVYTQDLSKALKAAKLIESGTVGINNVSGGEFAYPYGGWKQSGFGVENSHHVFNEYMYIKHVRIDY
ncbi:aldehyde dehydrogenase family protein [Thermotoga profunda]|uniref:aldehyde dehydrogenase family protein n=1 Tax=Thermotoga profunda TaxID=1508420 RepID=UPI000596B2A3|nr:NAD-dependent succinate-semialdehyde dehydrogenase [Thermotoga profunda]